MNTTLNTTRIAAILLVVSAFLFSFSVAATNVGLALMLVLGLLSGLWWKGAIQCWNNYRLLSLSICMYVAVILLGLLWSLDLKWGMHLVLVWRDWRRWAAAGLAGWSYIMIFSAQGRSGYLIAMLLLVCVCVKWLYDSSNWRVVLPTFACLLLIALESQARHLP